MTTGMSSEKRVFLTQNKIEVHVQVLTSTGKIWVTLVLPPMHSIPALSENSHDTLWNTLFRRFDTDTVLRLSRYVRIKQSTGFLSATCVQAPPGTCELCFTVVKSWDAKIRSMILGHVGELNWNCIFSNSTNKFQVPALTSVFVPSPVNARKNTT